MARTALIDTSTANIASVRFALERLDARYDLVRDPDEARDSDRLILPGVGAAGPAMTALRSRGWDELLARRERPLLGVCLGMQLLFEHSAEGDVALLGLLPGRVERLDPGPDRPWPHMGWNTLQPRADEPLMDGVEAGAHVYFVHGYYAPVADSTSVETRYGPAITAIARDGEIAGCQFHPERSGAVGARILANFVKVSS
ncbi:MAG: imidazole glycerol phosphate synthase subunit HisH [Pseudomonadota bacterium]